MGYAVFIASAAEDDLREAFLWYKDQGGDLGRRFAAQVASAIKSIQSNPLKTQVRYSNTRIFFLQAFPYGIHFQVDKLAHHVLIVAVFHSSQDSEKWRHR